MARVIRFPDRVRAVVLVLDDGDGWLVLAGAHGWLHGNRAEALRDAHWLAANRGWPVRGDSGVINRPKPSADDRDIYIVRLRPAASIDAERAMRRALKIAPQTIPAEVPLCPRGDALMMDLRTLAHVLGGEVAGRNSVLAPGPGHSPRDRSLHVSLDPTAPDGFLVKSFASDDGLVCKDHVRRSLACPHGSPATGRTEQFTLRGSRPGTGPPSMRKRTKVRERGPRRSTPGSMPRAGSSTRASIRADASPSITSMSIAGSICPMNSAARFCGFIPAARGGTRTPAAPIAIRH